MSGGSHNYIANEINEALNDRLNSYLGDLKSYYEELKEKEND